MNLFRQFLWGMTVGCMMVNIVLPRAHRTEEKMETGQSGAKPVVITDGKSNTRLFTSLVSIALVVGGLYAIYVFVLNPLLSAPITSTAGDVYMRDNAISIKVDGLIASGDLAKARALLEDMESARGLTPELSDKLDIVYIKQADQFAANGQKAEAIKVLTLIPTESAHYAKAQESIKKFNAVAPKATKAKSGKKPNPKHSSKSKAKQQTH